ncbi:MAG: hypothetical protein IT539_18180 [Bradyrhizobiaceae bacterium]|nr:hypothetical protein [Bradyrhizobiaceae bacterium]
MIVAAFTEQLASTSTIIKVEPVSAGSNPVSPAGRAPVNIEIRECSGIICVTNIAVPRRRRIGVLSTACLGSWIFARLGYDPVLGSGPVATVIQNVMSLSIYFLTATTLLL